MYADGNENSPISTRGDGLPLENYSTDTDAAANGTKCPVGSKVGLP